MFSLVFYLSYYTINSHTYTVLLYRFKTKTEIMFVRWSIEAKN